MQDIQLIAETNDGRLVCILSIKAYSAIQKSVGTDAISNIELPDIREWAKSFDTLVVMLDLPTAIRNALRRANTIDDYDLVHNSDGNLVYDESQNVVTKAHPPKIHNKSLHEEYLAGHSPESALARIAIRVPIISNFGESKARNLKARMKEKGIFPDTLV